MARGTSSIHPMNSCPHALSAFYRLLHNPSGKSRGECFWTEVVRPHSHSSSLPGFWGHLEPSVTHKRVPDIDLWYFKVTALALIWNYCNWVSSTYGFLYCLKRFHCGSFLYPKDLICMLSRLFGCHLVFSPTLCFQSPGHYAFSK